MRAPAVQPSSLALKGSNEQSGSMMNTGHEEPEQYQRQQTERKDPSFPLLQLQQGLHQTKRQIAAKGTH
jgi:hypothetical protein